MDSGPANQFHGEANSVLQVRDVHGDPHVNQSQRTAAARRTLVVLDNVCSPDQVRPLLPGSSDCFVLITSRSRLASLVARDGAQRLTLDLLSHNDSLSLFAILSVPGWTRSRGPPERWPS